MGDTLDIKFGNRALTLCAPGGLYDATTETLFVADCHFGKDATFRKHSIPVPTGSNQSTIAKINEMIEEHVVSRLVILGDMFHDRTSLSDETIQDLNGFFASHQKLDCFLVPGNHDADIVSLPEAWKLTMVQAGNHLDGLILSHYPLTQQGLEQILDAGENTHSDYDSNMVVLCGHLHPAIRIGQGIEQLKLPCFLLRDGNLILPAIGDFTGTHVIPPKPGDQIWIVADNELVPWKIKSNQTI